MDKEELSEYIDELIVSALEDNRENIGEFVVENLINDGIITEENCPVISIVRH